MTGIIRIGKRDTLTKDDGWKESPNDPVQHYIYQNQSICGKYRKIPKEFHHGNNPLKHCPDCEKMMKKLTLLFTTATNGKVAKIGDVFKVLEMLDAKFLRRGLIENQKTGEVAVAVLNSQEPERKETIVTKQAEVPKPKRKGHSILKRGQER